MCDQSNFINEENNAQEQIAPPSASFSHQRKSVNGNKTYDFNSSDDISREKIVTPVMRAANNESEEEDDLDEGGPQSIGLKNTSANSKRKQ